MTRIGRHTVAGALFAAISMCFVGAPGAFADNGDESAPRVRGHGGEVSFDVVERPLKDVVLLIQEFTEVNLVLAVEAESVPVTVKLKKLPWREALEVVVEKAGCQLDERSANLIRIERPPRVSFEFENADVRIVIKAIADIAGANIVVGREVEGTVTVSLHDIPWRVALDTISKTLGYTVVAEERGILRIVDPANLEEQMETQVYRLRFVRPHSPYRPKMESQVHESKAKALGTSMAEIEKEFNLLKAFQQALEPKGKVTYLKESNSLIATGTRPQLSQLEKLIARVDVEPAQVYVDVKFITTQNSDFLDLGVDPGETGIALDMSFGSMLHRLPFNLFGGGFEDSLSPFRGGPERFGPLPVTSSTDAFTFGTLDFSSTKFALNLVKTDKSSRIVQAPKLIALDNQEATIFVGETIRFAQTKAASNQSGGLEFSIDEADNSPVQVGFQLLIIPHVIPDKDQVIMTLIPQQRSLTGTSSEQPGFDVFTTGVGGTTGEQRIALPREQSSTVVTKMKLDNGQTAVVGGLLRDTETVEVNKIPFLGDLPVLGYLFRGETTATERTNLIIFVTPKIVRDSNQMRKLVRDELRDRQDRIEAELVEIAGDPLEDMGVDLDDLVPEAPNTEGPK